MPLGQRGIVSLLGEFVPRLRHRDQMGLIGLGAGTFRKVKTDGREVPILGFLRHAVASRAFLTPAKPEDFGLG